MTVWHMAKLSRAGGRSALVRSRAAELRAAGGGARALRAYVDRVFRFVPDPEGVELLKTPELMLEEVRRTGEASGDCDDAAILSAALALELGYQVRFIVLGFKLGGDYGHVYTDISSGGPWLELDVTAPAQFPPGLRVHRRMTVGV